MSLKMDVVGICRTCKGGIVLPIVTIEHEKGQTRRLYCKPACRKNRPHPRFWQEKRRAA